MKGWSTWAMAMVRLALAYMTVAPTPTLPKSDSSRTKVSLPNLCEEGRGRAGEREREGGRGGKRKRRKKRSV